MRSTVVFFFTMFTVALLAQSASKADELFNKKDYFQAGQLYGELLRKRPSDLLYNYRFARCQYELKEFDTAIEYFLKSGNRYPLTNYYLADSYFSIYQFEEAVRSFTAYAESSTVNDAFVSDVEDKLRRAAIAVRLLNRVEDVKITDSLVVNKKDFLQYIEISKEAGSLTQEHLYKDGTGWVDCISFTTQRGDRKIFSDTTHHSSDLFTANKLLDGWSKAERMSSQVNTSSNENYPFLMLDGLTLYFASDGEGSMGGYDIFVTRFSGVSNDYLNPDNIGMPFNSLANDYMLVIDELNHAGWFASDRFQPRNKVAVYRFVYSGEKKYLTNDSTINFRELASLRKIQWAEQENTARRRAVVQQDDKVEHTIFFRIMDNLVYTHPDQFKSTLAAELFVGWSHLSEELKQTETNLQDLRNAFSIEIEQVEKAAMAKEMIAVEREVIRMRRQLEASEKNIRNEEIKFLKKADVM